MTALEILTQARELLSNKARWTQGVYARNEEGKEVMSVDKDALCWCAIGAIKKASKLTWIGNEATNYLFRVRTDPVKVNDVLGYEATMEMFDDAIELAKEGA